MTRFLFATIIGFGLLTGCAHTDPRPAADGGGLDEAEVIAIARGAVAENDTWVDRAEFETPRRQPDGSWRVVVWRLPKVPGGHRMILIDEAGKITEYVRGR